MPKDGSLLDRFMYALDLIPVGKQSEFLGRSLKQICRYKSGSDIPLDVFIGLAKATGLPIEWLVTGVANPPSASELEGTFCLVPRFNISASAGDGALATDERNISVIAFRSEWLKRRGFNPDGAHAITARGDSMEPTIRDGDTLLLDTTIDQVKDNGIYVIILNEMIVVKRVHMVHGGSITLISDNQFYPPETILASEVPEVRFAGRVMWFGRSI